MGDGLPLPRWGTLVLCATGLAGGALYLYSGATSRLPGPGDAAKDWAAWAAANQPAAQVQVGLWLLTVLLLLLFGAYLVVRVSGAAGWPLLLSRVALVALGIRVAMELVSASILAQPTLHAGYEIPPALPELGSTLLTASLLPHAIFLTTLASAMLATNSVPRWIGWLTLAVGLIHVFAPVLLVVSIFRPLGLIGVVYGPIWYGSLPFWPVITAAALLVQSARCESPAQ